MKALTTRVGTYVTGDAVADAVLSYALALARRQRLDLVELPFRAAGGEVSRVQIRVGWMVDVDSISQQEQRGPELTDAATTDDLKARELALRSHGDTPLSPDELVSVGEFDEY